MVRRGFKKRVKVDPIDTQCLKVVKVVQYTLQVTTIEILTTRMVICIPLFSTSRDVGLITIGKAIWENLVPNRAEARRQTPQNSLLAVLGRLFSLSLLIL